MELAATLRERNGVQVEVIACDLETTGAVQHLSAELAARGIGVDILLNNAGFGSAGRFQRQGRDHVAKMTQLNCIALAELTHALLPRMLENQRGGVINVASVAAFVPTPFMAIYGATKAYVLSFTAALREELRGSGVHVFAVCPGPVPTEFQERAGYSALDHKNPAVLTTEQVVAQALGAYEHGEVVCVPGLVNRLQTALSGLLPIPWLAQISARVLRSRGRDL
jgi:short-subunit dehydrogenase